MVSPSAVCTVNGTPIQTSGTSGIDVAAGSTITIALVNHAGVNSWDVNCTMSDGNNPYSAFPLIQATKSLNQTALTCTFVMPALYTASNTLKWGASLQFVSVVNAGQFNANTFTFGVFIIGDSGVRLVFDGENFETNATYGVAPDINQALIGALTSLPVGPAGAGGGDLGGFYPDPYVRSISGYSPGNPVKMNMSSLYWDKTISAPSLTQDTSTTFMANGQTLTIRAQNAGIDGYGGTLLLSGGDSQIGSGVDGGDVIISGGLGTSTAHNGRVRLQNNGVDALMVGGPLSGPGAGRMVLFEYPYVLFELANIPDSQVTIGTSGTTSTPIPLLIQAGQSGSSIGGSLYLSSGDGTVDGTVYIKTGCLPTDFSSGLEVARFNPSGEVTIPGLNVAGVVHNNSSGDLSTSLIVNADISSSAEIAVAKLAVGTADQVLTTSGVTNTWAKIVNANVDTAAAIDGTKISPNFGSQNVSTTGTLSSGALTATSIRDTALGSGVVHSDGSGNLSSSGVAASDITHGTADQLLDTNHAGTATEWFTAGGDVSFASHNFTVIGLRGTSLDSSVGTVGAAQDGYSLVWSNPASAWKPIKITGGGGGGSVTWSDDLLGSTDTDQKVLNITGDNGLADSNYSTILVGGTTVPTLPPKILLRGTNYTVAYIGFQSTIGQNLNIQAGINTSGAGGDLQLAAGSPSGGGGTAYGNVFVDVGASIATSFNYNKTSNTYDFPTNTLSLGLSNFVWHPSIGSPTIKQNQLSGTGTTAGQNLTIQAQQGQTASGGTNNNGGNIVIQSGAVGTGGSGGTPGTISLNIGATTYGAITNTGAWRMAAYGAGLAHFDSSGNITSGTLVNADVSSIANIDVSKLAAGTAAQILLNNGTPTPTWTTVSGDATISATGGVTNVGIRGKTLASSLASVGATQDGYVLTWVNGSSDWEAKPGGGGGTSVTWANDLAGSTASSQYVVTLQKLNVSSLKTSNYTVTTTDYVVGIGTLSSSITITLPSSPTTGQSYIIKDVNGTVYQFVRNDAGTLTTVGYTVTITPSSGNIDGQANWIMSTPYQSVHVVYTGSQWSII